MIKFRRIIFFTNVIYKCKPQKKSKMKTGNTCSAGLQKKSNFEEPITCPKCVTYILLDRFILWKKKKKDFQSYTFKNIEFSMGSSSSKSKSKKDKCEYKENEIIQYSPPTITTTNIVTEKKDRSFYVQSNKSNETITRSNGDLSGNPFNANNLTNCRVIIEDFCDSINIDKCEECIFILSAIRGSIFVRSCKKSKFMVVCGQFRCFDCSDCDFLLHSKTGPAIESSKKIRIGCGKIGYEKLLENMNAAHLDPLINKWSDVHDFTPAKGNFEIDDKIPSDFYVQEKSILPFTVSTKAFNKFFNVKLERNKLDSVISLSNSNNIFVKIEISANGTEIVCCVGSQSQSNVQKIFQEIQPISIQKRKS